LILAILVAYLQIGSLDFIDFDDPIYITENRMVKKGLTIDGLIWAIKTFHGSNWHPLAWLSHMLDSQLYGLEPLGHHWTSLQLHIANTLLLFFILQKITGALWRSAAVAALFAVHPLNVESVAWVAERKNVLSSFLGMLTIGAYCYYVQNRRWIFSVLVFLFLSLGLMAKPMLVSFPLVLLLMDYWPLKRMQFSGNIAGPTGRHALVDLQSLYSLIMEKIHLFVLVGLASILTIAGESSMGAVRSLGDFPLKVRLANAAVSYCGYIVKAVLPFRLTFFYPHPGQTLPIWKGLGAALLIAAATFGILRASKRYPYLAFGWLWYLVTLIPVIGLVQIGDQSMADRYTYIPLIGIFIMAAWGGYDVAAKGKLRKTVLSASAGLLLAAFIAGTWFQVGIWKNSVTLFTHGLEVTSNNWRAHYGIGRAFDRQGKLDKAMFHYSKAVQINPRDERVRNNLGTVLIRLDKADEAMHHFNEALKIKPDHATAQNNLGVVQAIKENPGGAMYHFRAALRIDPNYDGAHANLADLLAEQGRYGDAVKHYQAALRINASNAQVHYRLGRLYKDRKNYDRALHHLMTSIRIESDYAEAYNEIGDILVRQGEPDKAREMLRSAARQNPGSKDIRIDLRRLEQTLTSTAVSGGFSTTKDND
jgi:tetratricopeptide (TPR) repeat protein